MLIFFLLVPAQAFNTPQNSDDCFPLRRMVHGELGRLSDDVPPGICKERVFVEEWSACEGAGAGGSLALQDLPQATTTGDFLVAVVNAYNRGKGLDYEVVHHAVGWVVRPIGVSRVLDTTVTLTPDRFPTVTDQFQDLKEQLKQRQGIHIGRQPTVDRRNTTATGVTAAKVTLLDAIARIHRPLEDVVSRGAIGSGPQPRIGLYLSVADARKAAATRLIWCEEPKAHSTEQIRTE